MLFPLEIATEAIGTQYLKDTEKYKQRQPCHEMMGCRDLRELFQCIIVFVNQLTTQLIGIFRRCLPEERGKVIIIRSLAPTLEINKIRIPLGVKHHVTSLEVTIEESITLLCRQVFG